MKKAIIFTLVLALAVGFLPAGMVISDAAPAFTDVPSNTWYSAHVQYVTNDPRQLMVGYAGKFGPLDNLTVEQFIKITVAAAGKSVTVPSGKYWGDVYTPIGVELGFVQSGEFTDYKRPITRAEMARIIIRALPSITGEKDITYNLTDIKAKMADYSSIPANLTDYVCKAYALGILVGGSDKKFNPSGTLTRASAAAVIHNMLDPKVRTPIVSETTAIWSDAEFEKYIRDHTEDYYCIAKIENRKIYWRNALSTTPTLLPEKNNPGVNDTIYNCAKILAYYAKKNGNTFDPGYNHLHGTSVSLNYIIVQNTGVPGAKDIGIEFYANPILNEYISVYSPKDKQTPSLYVWTLGTLYDREYIINQGYVTGSNMDRSKISWSQPKYEEIFLKLSQEVYGPSQGQVFSNFALEQHQSIFVTRFEKEHKFIGQLSGANFDVAFFFRRPEVTFISFWTGKPEVRK